MIAKVGVHEGKITYFKLKTCFAHKEGPRSGSLPFEDSKNNVYNINYY